MQHSQIDVGDVKLHVVEFGSGPAVVFCHGFPDVWIGWRRQMEALAAAGYRAIAIDMRGYGRSSGPDDPFAYTALHAIGDLVGLLDILALPHVAIVGHDFGAAVAWYATLLRPDRFRAVFAISVPLLPPGGPSLFTRIRTFDETTLRPDVPGLLGAVCLPDVGHWPHREEPEVLSHYLVRFLEDAYKRA